MATEHEAYVRRGNLMNQYMKVSPLSVQNVFKLRPEELQLFFRKEHLDISENKGETRESLRILKKVGMYDGLLKLIESDPLVRAYMIL